jgi:lysophospholipid acyltransferase (LPLAT)-like uncharacterized protein
MKIRIHKGAASLFGALYIRALGTTLRVEWRGMHNFETARKMSPQVIFAFFHGRLLVLSFTHRNRNIHVLASEHDDGDLMGKTIERLGFGHLKGSSSRGGARAIRELSGVLRGGDDIGLTVDGPRGPRGRVQQGAIEIGRLTGSVVLPISNTAQPRRLFDSWDRFQLPNPFARVVVAYGEPMVVPENAGPEERERLRLLLEERLRNLTAELDESVGYEGKDTWPHEDR